MGRSELLEKTSLFHPKLVLFVNHSKFQISEDNILLQQRMRPYDDLNLSEK
jgi:hypothetical protein